MQKEIKNTKDNKLKYEGLDKIKRISKYCCFGVTFIGIIIFTLVYDFGRKDLENFLNIIYIFMFIFFIIHTTADHFSLAYTLFKKERLSSIKKQLSEITYLRYFIVSQIGIYFLTWAILNLIESSTKNFIFFIMFFLGICLIGLTLLGIYYKIIGAKRVTK